MKRLFATTALALTLSAPSLALAAGAASSDASTDAAAGQSAGQETAAKAASGVYVAKAAPDQMMSSDVVGMTVYAKAAASADSAGPFDADATGSQAGPQWESVGEISDLLITRDGEVKAALVGVGGFLGIGQKIVAVPMEQFAWQTDPGNGETFLTLGADRAALEQAPDFVFPEEAAGTASGMSPATGAATGAAAGAAASSMAESAGDKAAKAADSASAEAREAKSSVMAAADSAVDEVSEAATEAGQAIESTADQAAESIDRAADGVAMSDEAGWKTVAPSALAPDMAAGATVYDSSGDDVGEVVKLVSGPDGEISGAVMDVGGFLGLGEHRVMTPTSALTFMVSDTDAQDLRVQVAASKAELKAMPAYKGDS